MAEIDTRWIRWWSVEARNALDSIVDLLGHIVDDTGECTYALHIGPADVVDADCPGTWCWGSHLLAELEAAEEAEARSLAQHKDDDDA